MTSPTDPNECKCTKCKCGAMDHIGTSRHINKEIPHFHRTDKDGNVYIETADGKLSPIETSAVEKIVEEHKQLEMFDADPTYGGMYPESFAKIEDLQEGDTVEES